MLPLNHMRMCRPIPVLPTVYSDALSYGEQVGKMGAKINEIIDFVNNFDIDIQENVDKWLDEHPEATTTVQDNSLTQDKFTEQLKIETIKDYGTPQMYGAKGDGINDDTLAIQQCVNEHAITLIPCGMYKITNTIVIPVRHEIHMQGYVETFLTTLIDRIDLSMYTVIKCEDNVPMFEVNNGSKIYGGIIWAYGSTKALYLNMGTKELSNIVLKTGICGNTNVANTVAIHIDGTTGTTGYLCLSTIDCAIAHFDKGIFFDRPDDTPYPWVTCLEFKGNFFNNRKGITNNYTNFGYSGGGSRYEMFVSGGYTDSDDAIFDITGNSNYVNVIVSDIGPTHHQKYAFDFTHLVGGENVIVNDVFSPNVKARGLNIICNTPNHIIEDEYGKITYCLSGKMLSITVSGTYSRSVSHQYTLPVAFLETITTITGENIGVRCTKNTGTITIIQDNVEDTEIKCAVVFQVI